MQQPQIDLASTTPLLSPNGNRVFAQGFILQKLSKFIAGTPEDAIIPIQIFYDIKTNKILTEMLPKELRQEFIDLYEKEDPTK
jgi:hypothetical protein